MTSSASSRDGNGGQDGGIGMSRRPADLDEIRGAVDNVSAAQGERERYLAEARHRLAVTGHGGDGTTMANVIAATNAAAAEDLDELLQTLHRGGVGAPIGGPDQSASDSTARSVVEGWADAGYTSASAVADWTSIGIDTPEIARQWGKAGFTAETAARWVEVPDMTPAEAATCANGGMTPTDVQHIRRADPGWARPEPEPPALETGYGIDL